MTPEVRRRLALLGLPTFGLALAITVVSTYLPTVAREFAASTVVIGVIIGSEGAFALVLPLLVGSWSDRARSRLPFVLAGVPLAIAGLLTMAVVSTVAQAAVAVSTFFAGYFIAYEPYRALYPDLVDEEAAGRAQSTQAVARGTGTVCALAGGGLLLALGQAVPFIVAALVLGASCGAFALIARRRVDEERERSGQTIRETLGDLGREVRREPGLRAFFAANALWELSLAALKTFVVLWLTEGLGVPLASAALLVGGVAVFVLVGAAASGSVADRFGRRRTIRWAAALFGVTLLVPFVTTSHVVLALASPAIALGGGALMAQPYALLVPLMPDARHGTLTGFYSFSRGLGVMAGPLLAGAAISLGGDAFSSTEGYGAMWGVCAAAALASIPLAGRVRPSGGAGAATT